MKAILSVYDKTGITELARELTALGVEVISSGGTFSLLQKEGISATAVSDVTGFPECLDGRVKTLHPKIHGGILANRNLPSHVETLAQLDIAQIDLVVVNLYPFRQTIARADHTFADAIENIDIGGPTMIRSAAKNHEHVLVVVDPSDYPRVIEALKSGAVSQELRRYLAQKAFALTAGYDSMIAAYLMGTMGVEQELLPEELTLHLTQESRLRYGENPHQEAAFYRIAGEQGDSYRLLAGKELSYNNYNDAQGAIALAQEFDEAICVAVKHATPCGVATGATLAEAYLSAYESDPVSIFGGIVCVNRTVDRATAEEMHKIFLEVIIAPAFDADALAVLTQKPNLRLVELPSLAKSSNKKERTMRSCMGGMLMQTSDSAEESECSCPTAAQVSAAQEQDLRFAMKVVKHVKSNAIVVAKDGRTLGIGGGQVSRIWAAEQALQRSGEAARGAVLASDAFFPFDDVVNLAAEYGIAAIIQPGGSIKDQDSIAACDRHQIAMLMTGVRHFRH